MEIKLNIEAPALVAAINKLAEAVANPTLTMVKDTNPAKATAEAPKTKEEPPATPDTPDEGKETELAQKTAIAEELKSFGVKPPRKNASLATFQAALVQARMQAQADEEDFKESNDDWDDESEEEPKKEAPVYEYTQTKKLAKCVATNHPERGKEIRRILDENVGENVGLQEAFDNHKDKIAAIVADLEESAGVKYDAA